MFCRVLAIIAASFLFQQVVISSFAQEKPEMKTIEQAQKECDELRRGLSLIERPSVADALKLFECLNSHQGFTEPPPAMITHDPLEWRDGCLYRPDGSLVGCYYG